MRRHDREITSMEDIREILNACKICRLGMADNNQVYIVPMNYGYEFQGDRLILYFHGAREGKKLELLRKNPAVGIEMDCGHELKEGSTACQYSCYYGSIIGSGKAQLVRQPGQKLEALAVIMKHQTGKDFTEFEKNPRLEKTVEIIRVEVEQYTCKRHSKAESCKNFQN